MFSQVSLCLFCDAFRERSNEVSRTWCPLVASPEVCMLVLGAQVFGGTVQMLVREASEASSRLWRQRASRLLVLVSRLTLNTPHLPRRRFQRADLWGPCWSSRSHLDQKVLRTNKCD